MAPVIEARLSHLDDSHISDTEAVSANSQGGDLVGRLETGHSSHFIANDIAADDAGIDVLVGRVDGAQDLAGIDTVSPQGIEIEIDADLLLLDPVEVDAGHALDAFQRPADAPVEKVPRLGQIPFGGNPSRQHLSATAVSVSAD